MASDARSNRLPEPRSTTTAARPRRGGSADGGNTGGAGNLHQIGAYR